MNPIAYEPAHVQRPERVLDVPSAWVGIESILPDLVGRFCTGRKSALEFGVEHGYSTVALSNFFDSVVGVDTFLGDQHTGTHESYYEATRDRLKPYENIKLESMSWQAWTLLHEDERFDLVHIDIEHTWEQTYGCGMWAARHSPCVIFHDTLSFSDVMRAVSEIAEQRSMAFYNFPENSGLGILVGAV
jgi:hypothetical protein